MIQPHDWLAYVGGMLLGVVLLLLLVALGLKAAPVSSSSQTAKKLKSLAESETLTDFSQDWVSKK